MPPHSGTSRLYNSDSGLSNLHVLGLRPRSCIFDNPSSSLYNLYMYLLTNLSGDPPQLRVVLADWEGNTAFAKYDQFSVGDEVGDDCYRSLLTGKYYTSGGPRHTPPHGINWTSWKGLYYSLHYADMKIRPGGV